MLGRIGWTSDGIRPGAAKELRELREQNSKLKRLLAEARHRHSALGYRTPAEYAATCRCQHTLTACDIA